MVPYPYFIEVFPAVWTFICIVAFCELSLWDKRESGIKGEGMATKYPIGIQSFETIISDGYAYVDKTEYIHNLPANIFPLVVRAVSGSRFCYPP